MTKETYSVHPTDREIEEFFAEHAAAGGLVLAIVHEPNDTIERHGIFSTLAKAYEWADTFPEDRYAIFSPYILDDPEWGNRTTS